MTRLFRNHGTQINRQESGWRPVPSTSRRLHRLLAALLLALLPLLTACSTSSGEKQIFPICLSMDRLQDGRLQLAVQVNSMAGDSSTEYAQFSAAGDSFDQTLEILGASMPYPLHFGQLRLCMLGYDLAASEDLRSLLEPIGQLYTINPEATVVVCTGNAAEIMAAQTPDLGVRLSTYLDQLLARLRQEKLTPPETLRDVLRMLDSGYGDPLLGLCAINQEAGPDQGASDSASGGQGGSTQGEAQSAFSPSGRIAIGEPSPGDDLPTDLAAGSLPRKGGNPVEYIGCAAVGGGRVGGTLTALETRMLLTLRQQASISHVTASGARVSLPGDCGVTLQSAAELLTKLQLLDCDALGLGAAIARQTLTNAQWDKARMEAPFPQLPLTIVYQE